MQDLQEVTHEIHYENYRSDKLQPKKNNLRSNEIDADEQQKKLIKEKDDEVTFFVKVVFIEYISSFVSFVECKTC